MCELVAAAPAWDLPPGACQPSSCCAGPRGVGLGWLGRRNVPTEAPAQLLSVCPPRLPAGDKTVRLWSLVDGACLRTFEGHLASVLRLDFLSAGTQILSAGADGLIKLWSVRMSGGCLLLGAWVSAGGRAGWSGVGACWWWPGGWAGACNAPGPLCKRCSAGGRGAARAVRRSRADSGSSMLSQGSTSGASDQLAGSGSAAAAPAAPLAASHSGSAEELEPAPSGGSQEYGEPSQLARSSSGGGPLEKMMPRAAHSRPWLACRPSSPSPGALPACPARLSCPAPSNTARPPCPILSPIDDSHLSNRSPACCSKVDAEALQAIKSQRAKARAEGPPPAPSTGWWREAPS